MQRMGGFKRVAAALELAYLPARRGRSAAGAWSPGDVQSPLALVQFGSSQHTVSISEVPHNSSLARPRMTQRLDTCGTCQGRCSATRAVTSIAEVGKQLPSISELWIALDSLCRCGSQAPLPSSSVSLQHTAMEGSKAASGQIGQERERRVAQLAMEQRARSVGVSESLGTQVAVKHLAL